jgi:hypothetical protein
MLQTPVRAETPEDNAHLWSKRLLLVAYLAQREGLAVEFVPHNPEHLAEGFRLSYLKINDKLTSIQVVANVQTRPDRRQASAATGVWLHTLLEVSVVCMILCPNGYPMRILHIPAADLLRTYFDDEVSEGENIRKTFAIPLVYRPEDPKFDFLKYEDDWSVYQ